MPEEKKEKKSLEDVEELKEVLSVVSDKIPALIKGLVSSVFSEDSATNLGKATAKFYQELKEGGIPDDVALQMTQNYMGMFSKFSGFARSFPKEAGKRGEIEEEIESEIKRAIHKKLKKVGEEEEQ